LIKKNETPPTPQKEANTHLEGLADPRTIFDSKKSTVAFKYEAKNGEKNAGCIYVCVVGAGDNKESESVDRPIFFTW